MFRKIAGFELRYQLKSPVFWVVATIFFLLTFGAATIDQIRIGGGGNIHKNAPFAIAQTHIILSIFYMFVTTAFVANVVVRDDETGFGPILRSTRVRKFDYLYGRFAGAFLAAAISFLVVPLAIWLGSFMPWIDPERLGPNDLHAYLFSYFVLALPTILLTSALFFALATVTRSMMWTYVGVIAFLVLWIVAGIALRRPEYAKIAAYWEPLGASAFGQATRYWTASERNSLVPPFTGALLFNRVFVSALAVGFLGLAHGLFRFQSADLSGQRKVKATKGAANEAPPSALAGPLPAPRFDRQTAWAQLVVRTRLDMGQVFKSPAYFVLLFLGLANAMGSLWFATEAGTYGGVIYPVTRVLIEPLLGSFSLIPVIIAIYYSGELVWRERERKTHEIIDATPVPDWAFVVPKTLAISLVLVSTLLISVLAAVLSQALHGYFNFEFEKYLLWYLLPQSVDWILLAALAVFLQALSPHKFIGWGLMVIYLVTTITFVNLGFEHKLYNYGSVTSTPFSDMNGQGKFWIGAWWLRAYWSAFALVLLVLAHALWRRGTESRLLPRLRRLPVRLNGGAGILMTLS
ncbi:MAG: ABC transporter permease, partial [Caulobacter sp.]|nr:ABC transporter permease [Caulobacter sp.]